jgi:tetratricopeptide (TPR) repeat protein
MPDADMLLGADFFVSHHVFVANSQRKLYLTYNGGAVFNLSKGAATQESNPQDAEVGAAVAAPEPAKSADMTAAEMARRGAASAARRDYGSALAELSKAVELDPEESEYLCQRALVYRLNGQPALALADLDRALVLKPDFLPAYLPRAEIRLSEKNLDGAVADLDAVDRLAAKQSDLRLTIATRYEAADKFTQAIAEYDLWIQNHPEDSRIVDALGARCLASALQNQDLTGGLVSCNRGLKIADRKNPNYGRLFANRGFIRLRQGEYQNATSDFDAALLILPKSAPALYGRGIAKMSTNNKAAGEADIAAAIKIAPNIEEQFKKRGIAPEP